MALNALNHAKRFYVATAISAKSSASNLVVPVSFEWKENSNADTNQLWNVLLVHRKPDAVFRRSVCCRVSIGSK